MLAVTDTLLNNQIVAQRPKHQFEVIDSTFKEHADVKNEDSDEQDGDRVM